MGYSLEMGYADEVIDTGQYREVKGFEQATVSPFIAGSNIELFRRRGLMHRFLGSLLSRFRDEPKPVVPAEVDITFNYSKRIDEITSSHLSNLHGQRASEGAFMLKHLVAELKPEKGDTEDYWKSTDGNIKHLAETLLDWTVQHPDAVFYSTS